MWLQVKFTDRNNNRVAQTQHRSTYLQLFVTKWQKWAFLSLFSFSAVKQADLRMKQQQIFALQANCSLFSIHLAGCLVGQSVGVISLLLIFSYFSLFCCLPLPKNIFPSPNIYFLFPLRSLLPRGKIFSFALFNS